MDVLWLPSFGSRIAKLEESVMCTVVDSWDGPVGAGVGLLSRGSICIFSCGLRAECLVKTARGLCGFIVVGVVEFLAASRDADGTDRGLVRFKMLSVCPPRIELTAMAR